MFWLICLFTVPEPITQAIQCIKHIHVWDIKTDLTESKGQHDGRTHATNLFIKVLIIVVLDTDPKNVHII